MSVGHQPDQYGIEPMRIAIADVDIADLRDRVHNARWPNEVAGAEWSQGVDLAYLRALASHWVDDYDWRAAERRLNRWPSYTTQVDGQNIHFIHARSREPRALPLLLTHGWPGSVAEFVHLVEPLVDPVSHGGRAADAFDVVIPSIPGYGFFGPTTESGWDGHRVAAAWSTLMERLGYDRYGAHGGDWGSAISRCLSAIVPQRVCGVHLTMFAVNRPADDPMDDLDEREVAAFANAQEMDRHRGYISVQSTRPQTLGYGLEDSPTGLLAWIADKFWAWTDHNGNPEDAVARDDLLTNASIYWYTQTATSAARLYYETIGQGRIHPHPVDVPLGLAVFPKELSAYRKAWVERDNNLQHWTTFARGGHFPALEVPSELVEDLRSFFRTQR